MRHSSVAFDLLRWAATQETARGVSARQRITVDVQLLDFLKSREIDSLYHIATGTDDVWQTAYDFVWAEQRAALRGTLQAFGEAGVRALTFKSAELVPRHFGGRSLGFMVDTDLLIPREQIETAKTVLYGAGFRHGVFDKNAGALRDRDVRDVAQIELHHYELAPFTRLVELDANAALLEVAAQHDDHPLYLVDGRPVAVLEIDIHHNVASDAEPAMFFERAVPSTLEQCETFCAADHVWFNLSRYYNEVALFGKRSLRPVAYTLPEIAHGGVDWSVVETVAEELKLGPTLYYFLTLCDRINPGIIPEQTIEKLSPERNSRIRDWGWQLGKLFDFIEDFPELAFSES